MDAINIIQSNLPRMNETSQEEHFGVSQVAETLGLFLYLINPIKSSFETIEECPDYVNQVGDPGRSLCLYTVHDDAGNPLYYVDDCRGGRYQSFCEGQTSELG